VLRRPSRLELLGLLPERILRTRFDGGDGALYLSFDDGPHAEATPRVLDLLAEHQARASFFLVGAQAEAHPDLVRRIVAEGHRLANHSFSHRSLPTLSAREQIEEIERTDRVLERFDGRRRHWFRPPRGEASLALLLRCAFARRPIAFWSYDTLDYRNRPHGELLERMRLNPPRPGDVLLLHDDTVNSIDLLAGMLRLWQHGPYRFLPLPEPAN
jgi:peptidoglycan/xylan/chitin deacetylase (PgdA/CDA1 family)